MSYLLEMLGRGLLAELAAAFRGLLYDDGLVPTKELETAVEREPQSQAHHRRLAVRMLADRQYGRARGGFLEALKLDPTDRVAQVGLACTLDELGQTRVAAERLREFLVEKPEDVPTV